MVREIMELFNGKINLKNSYTLKVPIRLEFNLKAIFSQFQYSVMGYSP